MSNNSNNLGNIIRETVFPLFEQNKWAEGCKQLKKLSFEINRFRATTEEKRLLYYNLAWVLDELEEKETARQYIKHIKNIIEEDKEYLSTNEEKYLIVMNLYNFLVSDAEKIEDKEKLYNNMKNDVNYLDQALMAKMDIYNIKKDYESIADLCEMIHNYRCSKKINSIIIPIKVLNKLEVVQRKMVNLIKDNDRLTYEDLIDTLQANNSMTLVVDSI